MKALNSRQVLISIFIVCGLMLGIAGVSFWQYKVIAKEQAADKAADVVNASLQK